MTERVPSFTPQPIQRGALADARILLIDDDKDLLQTLSAWFGLFCSEVHTASNGVAALEIARQRDLDVVLTDLRMPGFDGLQVLSVLKDLHPHLAVVFLTGDGTMQEAILALREGQAFDFLQKPVRDFKALNDVLERAIASARVVPAASPAAPVAVPAEGDLDSLSPRELEVVVALAAGLDNRLIAERLCLSEKTVKNHLTRIYEKLHVTNRVQAVMLCQGRGLI